MSKSYAEKKYTKALEHIPELKDYREVFMESVEQQKSPEPIKKLIGEYELDVDINQDNITKVKSIQNQIVDYLQSSGDDGSLFAMSPNDRKGVTIIDQEGNRRRTKLSRLLKKAPPNIKKLPTMYPKRMTTEKIRLQISDDPVDIVRKASSRSWAHESCERIGSNYGKGSFSDIKEGNAIAYFYYGENEEPLGRMMVRWCESDKTGKPDVGIETTMYPKGEPFSNTLANALFGVIKSKGMGDYNICETPYVYKGWSDEMGKPNTKIRFKPISEDFSLLDIANSNDINYATANQLFSLRDDALQMALAENETAVQYDRVFEKMLDTKRDDIVANAISRRKSKIDPKEISALLR